MSFLDDLGGFAAGIFGGNSLGSSLARTALTGLALNQISKSINNDKATSAPDEGVRIQSAADTEKKIPVVYGKAVLGGILTDAHLSSDNLTMHFCFTICEKTGLTNLGAGAASEFAFKSILWNDCRLFFGTDGVTVTHSEDRDGTVDNTINGLIEVYCFAGNSDYPQAITGYTAPTLTGGLPAYSIFPNWTNTHDMSNLIFAIVKMKYNKEKNVTNVGNFRFEIENSMKAAGDCMYDYMTNTRYGAGLLASEIYVS